ncbi:Versicolorin B desaturase [Lecanosticta acicola]|uniref:Versicolorin B desaturase n=1 Tax=Lecanosticta acicola TaxID=111012 RepID=A0AAI9EB79_9PEZI|nr:Versicolorin B desaturase [Lecanosticta acicola]
MAIMAADTNTDAVRNVLRLSTIFSLLGFVTLIVYILSRAAYNILFHPLRSYPGPLSWTLSSIPLDYHTWRGTANRQILRLHQEHGPVVRLSPNELSYADAQIWKDVWAARNPEFPKRRTPMPPNGSYSILNAPKDHHARFRRLLAHAFSERGLRDQEPRIKQYVDLLVERLQEVARTGQSTDIVDWYTRTVFDVIGDLAWGGSFDGVRNRSTHDWIPAILANVKYVLQGSILSRWHLDRLKTYLLDQKVVEQRMKNYSLSTEKTKRRAQYGGEPRGDFFDRVLIKSADDNKTGEGMSLDEMVNNTSVLVLGGAETSATTLSGTTWLLLNNPAAMEKLQQEIRSAFKSSDDIDLFSVNRLSYMLAVLDETMRMYSPVPDPAQRVVPAGGGAINGKYLPEGTVIHGHSYAAGYLESNFHRPNDFVPERWLSDAPPEFADDNKGAFQPFAAGNRNCIGKNLAYADMRLILAKVLYSFDLELDREQNRGDWMEEQKAYAVWFKGSLHVKLTPAKH